MKTKITLGILAGALLVPMAIELPADTIAADAKWVARFDVEKFKTTHTAALLMQHVDERARNKIAAFAALFQFDPRKDLRDITAYGLGTSEDDGVLIVRGRFDAEHLVTLLRSNRDYVAHAHGAQSIHSWIDDKERARATRAGREPKRAFAAFVDGATLVVGGRLDSVTNGFEVQTGARPGVSLVQWFSEVAQFAEAPVFVAGARLAEIQHLAPNAALLKQARSAVVHLDEADGQIGVWAMLDAQNPEMVEALQQVAGGLIALWKIKAQELGFEEHLAGMARVKIENNRLIFHTTTSARALLENIQKRIQNAKGRE